MTSRSHARCRGARYANARPGSAPPPPPTRPDRSLLNSARWQLGIAVDLWDGEVTVGAITTNGPADKEGTLIQGDIIRAVDGQACATIEEVTMCVIKGGIKLNLSICRRPVSTVLESEVKMKMPSGEWDPFAFRLLSNRNIEFEKLSPPQYTGEIHARLAHSLDLKEDGVDKVLNIETGHKTFELKANSDRELSQWHLRLQEVIMLQEKVANVAHGWLLKEEGGASSGVGTELRCLPPAYWHAPLDISFLQQHIRRGRHAAKTLLVRALLQWHPDAFF